MWQKNLFIRNVPIIKDIKKIAATMDEERMTAIKKGAINVENISFDTNEPKKNNMKRIRSNPIKYAVFVCMVYGCVTLQSNAP